MDAIRFVNIENVSEAAQQDDFKRPVQWKVAGPDTTLDASAVCYHMAAKLQKSQKVAVGFINSSWGGTTIQGWISAGALRTLKPYEQGVAAVATYARDRAQAVRDVERLQEQWWDAHDRNAKAQRAWIAPDFNDAAWPSMTPNGPWKESGIAAFAGFDGVAWFRTSVTLTERQASSANQLLLGQVDTFDTTWVNGVRVGSVSTGWVWREYGVPAGVFKPGRNVIAMRVLNAGGGGLTSAPAKRGIKTADGEFIALSGPWKYQLGMRATGLKVDPAPWDVPTSLTTLYNAMIAP
ncbi:MAG: glycoside hydrolase family 2, partial [Gammaproteobacteria bacterium]